MDKQTIQVEYDYIGKKFFIDYLATKGYYVIGEKHLKAGLGVDLYFAKMRDSVAHLNR